jgi:hypothetical protein
MSADPEKRLAVAHAKLATARAILADAKIASEGGRKFSAQVGLELAALARKNEDLAATRAATLKQALKLGSTTPLPKTPRPASDHVARREAEERFTVSGHVIKELLAEEDEARLAVDAALAELNAIARDILGEEAAKLAAKISALDAESMQHRIAIEAIARSNCMGWAREIGLNDAVREVLRTNTLTEIGTKNHALWRSANVEAERVRQLHAARLSQVPAPASAVPAPASA